LAIADLQEVLKVWEGLGHYRRAEYLHPAARVAVANDQGKLPVEASALQKLPGVGSYTAAAVPSIAFGRRELALDGNAVGVLSRCL